MTFRARILAASLIVGVLSLALFAVGVRLEVRSRMTSQYQERVATTTASTRENLARNARVLDQRLRTLAARITDDALMRAALTQGTSRLTVLDYASSEMRSVELDYLLLLDSAGQVLSSGHFRNDFDRVVPALTTLLNASGPVLVSARQPEASFLALVRAHAFELGDRRFVLTGGFAVDSAFLQSLMPDPASPVMVALEFPGGALVSGNSLVAAGSNSVRQHFTIPFIDEVSGRANTQEARWTIAHSLAPLRSILRPLDVWLLAAIGAALVFAFLVARVMAARVNQPLEELASKTNHIDLERLDVEFATERNDEIGSLARMLDAMVHRLRASARQLRAAERRATVGELARQVNHDIRNGLLPIRNVIRHLSEVAHANPAELESVFTERESTLQGGITYLESLANNYARLTPRAERRICDVNALVRTVVRDSALADRARVQVELSTVPPRVSADPVALRRVIENLLINAVESLENGDGRVTVGTRLTETAGDRRVIITVADTGAGIEPEALDR
ncbi:MAG TPA: ATP-binding protein, partial [Longimicrobiales bacterium]|nr:ATP-binding protein [Longimicrobiales bacterium]